MWDRDTFVRPAAHRGLHDQAKGVLENTWPAFEAALAGGFGLECDLQSSRDNVPLVFHDDTLDRLMDGQGRLANLSHDHIKALRYKNQTETILPFETLLERVAGRAPLLVELKSDWSAPNLAWIDTICHLSQRYHGCLALMSFDPDVLQAVRHRAPEVARGLVSGDYRHPDRDPWYADVISDTRATSLTNLEPIDTVQPDFIAYHVHDLNCPAIEQARHTLNLPIFTWTVRSDEEWQLCNQFADAAIFEGAPR